MTLRLALDPTRAEPLFLQIAEGVRSAIASGVLEPGARLPSARTLAANLAVARGTVDAAYTLLANEGAVRAQGSAGTVVCGGRGARSEATEHTPFMFEVVAPAPVKPLLFQPGLPALDVFPVKLWSGLVMRKARSLGQEMLVPPDPAGLPALREAVATYLGHARGVRCPPAQVLITAGYQGALSLVRAVLLRPGDPVWMEDPGYPLARQALEASGARVVPIRMDAAGLRVASGASAAPKARLAVVTPGNQYPTGVMLSLPRRVELLNWAAEAGAWVLEDDYDSEFRYAGRPAPALKSIDQGHRVLYAGSFSKVMFPALRLGYLVVPPELADAFHRAARLLTAGLPVLEQEVLAAWLNKGHLVRHVRRMRGLYAARRDALAAALDRAFGNRVEVLPATGGLHLLARFPGAANDGVLAKRAQAAGLGPVALSTLTLAHDHGQGVLLSFANIAAEDADAAVARLLPVVAG